MWLHAKKYEQGAKVVGTCDLAVARHTLVNHLNVTFYPDVNRDKIPQLPVTKLKPASYVSACVWRSLPQYSHCAAARVSLPVDESGRAKQQRFSPSAGRTWRLETRVLRCLWISQSSDFIKIYWKNNEIYIYKKTFMWMWKQICTNCHWKLTSCVWSEQLLVGDQVSSLQQWLLSGILSGSFSWLTTRPTVVIHSLSPLSFDLQSAQLSSHLKTSSSFQRWI